MMASVQVVSLASHHALHALIPITALSVLQDALLHHFSAAYVLPEPMNPTATPVFIHA